jgi:methionine synthase II (cobalamin-independent)
MDRPAAFSSTVIGSFPHRDGAGLSRRLVTEIDIPSWPQLPRRTFLENMYVQYSASLPRIEIDEVAEKIIVNTAGDLSDALEQFYSRFLADDLAAFALTEDHAAGFFEMTDALAEKPGDWAKGQVTGPISFGLTVTDQSLRASLYNEFMADVIVKNMAMNARWQIQILRALRPGVVVFVDEPYMAAFGSAFVSLDRAQVVEMLEELFVAIHHEGALSGVHCCANTDWSVLLATSVDILNLDAYGYLENLALYPAELRRFLDRGGLIAWGIVPNNEMAMTETAESLASRLRQGMALIRDKAQARGVMITTAELAERSLISPSCGLGSTSEAVTDRALTLLAETCSLLRQG